MKAINANTKIAYLLKAHPDAMEAIISIDSKFNKLRNPFLRKVLAGRTSIAMASKIAGCKVEDFFNKLRPLGFEIDTDTVAKVEEKKGLPAFITSLKKNQIIDLDVRGLLDEGKDPLKLILDKVKSIQAGEALKVINTFEPTPLIFMLEKQGFEAYADAISDDLIETYFFKKSNDTTINVQPKTGAESGWEEILERFKDKLTTVDVRDLEMPKPMLTILGELENLADDTALFVYHKRIPVFLLPELSDRKLDYRIKEISEGEVRLLIFKN
ncbi:MAG TPA: DUF2249 domain-containing protein [Chitinophagales bacterium]|nr:DUF2249 domain-containing protein [Chitinophagales bacterium]